MRKRPQGTPELSPEKKGLHPRSRHRERYDFPRLQRCCPELTPFVAVNVHGDASIDFADPRAVRALNKALLAQFYGVAHWDLPEHCLCPPVPGRADYLHHLADLLASDNGGAIPAGAAVRALDIGTGASCIYPLIGQHEYGWRFLGSDIDPRALAAARRTVQANGLAEAVELRLQPSPERIFEGLLRAGEVFDLTLCNPPFHASQREAQEGTARKWRNLGRDAALQKKAPVLNFGGQGAELWCPGGEAAFVARMIEESAGLSARCLWFTTLVSKASNLPAVRRALKQTGALETRILDMAQGQKKSRIVAWTFLEAGVRKAWALARWAPADRG